MGKIDIQDVNLYYGNFHALKSVNLSLPEKQISAFIGPSGCGKTPLGFPAASNSGFASPGPWPWSRRCCSWTNPPPPWTPSPR